MPCKCSLATKNLGGDDQIGEENPPNWVSNKDVPQGYCGSILGTLTYQNALINLKRMLEKSECHSLDRHDYTAQLDCNTEFSSVKNAVKSMFEMNYWPYVQDDAVRSCIESISKDSWLSINKSFAKMLTVGSITLIALQLYFN